VRITAGKLAGMKAVSNDRGVIAAAAMDQRGSLKKSLAKEKGAEVSDHEMEEFKSLVTEVLDTAARQRVRPRSVALAMSAARSAEVSQRW